MSGPDDAGGDRRSRCAVCPHDEPSRRPRRRHRDRLPRRGSAPRHGVRPVPPHRPGRRRAGVPDLRSSSRRGRLPDRRGRRAVHARRPSRTPSWRRATSSPARSTGRQAAGPTRCSSASPTSTPSTIRSRFANLAEGVAAEGLDLTRDAIPVAPAAHYLMGGIETDLRRLDHPPRALRQRRVRCDRRARRQPAGLQLAARVLRLLSPRRRRRSRRRAGRADRHPGARPAPPAGPAVRAPRGDVGGRRPGPGCPGPHHAARTGWTTSRAATPYSSSRVIAVAALRRCESRGAHTRLDHPAESPTLSHSLRCPPLHLTV